MANYMLLTSGHGSMAHLRLMIVITTLEAEVEAGDAVYEADTGAGAEEQPSCPRRLMHSQGLRDLPYGQLYGFPPNQVKL